MDAESQNVVFENVERPEHGYIPAQLWYGFGVLDFRETKRESQ